MNARHALITGLAGVATLLALSGTASSCDTRNPTRGRPATDPYPQGETPTAIWHSAPGPTGALGLQKANRDICDFVSARGADQLLDPLTRSNLIGLAQRGGVAPELAKDVVDLGYNAPAGNTKQGTQHMHDVVFAWCAANGWKR